MKTKRILLCFMLMVITQAIMILVGCGGCAKNYDKVSIELDKTVMTMFMDETLNTEGSDKLKATILGLEEDMVSSFSYLVSDPNVATMSEVNRHENVTDFQITPFMGGETEIFIISNETSTKTASATLRVIEPLKDVEVNNTVSLYVTVGKTEKTLSITPSNVLKFTPETTSEKFFSFEVLNYNSEVAYYDNETNLLTIKPEITQGVLELKAKFDFDKEKNTFGEEIYNTINEVSNNEAKSKENLIIKIFIIKEIDETLFTLSEGGTPLSRTDGKYNTIELVQNSSALCSKEITATLSEDLINTEGFTYKISARCTTGNDMDVTMLSPETDINNIIFNLTAVFQNENAIVTFFVTINEVVGYEQRFDLPFRIILIPEIIKVNGDENNDELDAVVYSRFQNNGTKFTIDINPIGAENRKFYIEVLDEYKEMIEIVNATDGVVLTDKQVLKSGQSVFVRSKNNSVGNIYITIVALGTTSYEAIEPLTRKINLKLVIGAEEIKTLLDTIYIEKGETFNMEFSFDNNEAFTEYIFSKSIDDTVCKVPAEMIGTSRVLPIEAVGVGKTTIRMELSNGVYTLINIICYMTFEDFGVELPSANEPNSPVSQAIYTTDNAYDQTKVKTVSSAKLNINSTLYLTLLPYNVEEIGEGEYRYIYNKEALNPINLSQSFVSNDTSILKIDSTGYITCLKEGQVEIDCTVTVFVNAFDGSDTSKYGTVVKKHLNYKFIVDVIIPIQSFEIIGSSIKVYAYNKLSYYDQQKGAGTITLNIKILPSNATFNPQDIIWTADNTYFVPKGNVTPSGLSATFDCHLGTGHLTQETSVNVRLSANGRNYSSTKMVSIISPQKVNYINLHNVPDYTLDTKGNEIPYIYFDGRKGLFTLDNSINLGAECVPQNAYNTNVRYVVGKGLGEDPNPIIKVDEKGNIIPIANGYCYLYVVAEDWFTSEADYSDYENNVRVVAVKVADGKTKATAIDINSARELMEINTVDGLKLHYVIQDNLDMTNYSDFISFGLFEKVIEENNISITTLEKVPFTGSLDACYNVFGTATQYKINGLSIKNTKYVREDSASLYYASSLGNNYTLNFGLFAENQGELSNLICDVSSIMVETTGLDDKATTNFGVLAGVNSGLIENCEVNISNLSGNELYVKANTTFVNVGVITGQNKGFITKITQDDEDTYEIHDAFVNNCISDGVINVFVYSSTPKGETQKVSRNTIYVGGLVGKNATERVNVSQDEKYLAKAVIQTLQDSRNPLYKDGPYNYYSGNITFESEEMNVRGTININLDTATFVNPIGVGGICGYSDGEILNVASEITINALNTTAKYGAENVGGICGISNYSTIKGVYFSGTISGYNNVGGICGTFSGSMENAIVEFMDLVGDEVFGKTSITAMGNAGSLAGTAYSKTDDKSTITYSFARSYFVREMIADNYVGDLYVIIDKNAEQNVNVGGLVGYAENTQISLSYSYINMYIEDENMKGKIAGIVGYSENSVDIEDCYLRGLIYINNENKDTYTVSAISNNSLGFQASNFYSTCGVKFASFDNYDYVELNANGSELYSGIEDISQITGFNIWDIDNWEVEDYYNNELPYIMYNGKRMLNEPPTSISYDIKPSTIQSNSDLYKLNKFIRVDGQTILLFKYDNQDLDSYNLNKILDFTIPPYFIGGVAQFNDMATIRLTIKSSDTSIAQINSNGTLTLYGEGTVQITIASMLNKKAFANIYIVVMNVTTGFDIYKNNLFTETIGSSIDDRLLIKKGTNLEIYPYISGNSDIMIEYSVNSAIFYPIIFANSGEWVQKDLAKSCLDIAYSGTHVIQAINPGTTMVEAKLFVYINDSKVYLPYSKTFYAQSFEGLNDFTLSHSSFTGIIKDRYEFTAKVATDIVDRTEFTIEALIADNNGNTNKYIEYNDKKYKVSDILDVNIVTKTKSQTEVEYSVYVEINDDYKASDLFFETRNFIIRCKVDDGQNINYGIIQQLDVSITINPQDVSAVETMFFGGAEVVYDANLSNPMYNVAEVDTDVITAGEIGIFKVFIYPEFSQIKNVYIYAASTDGEFMSIQQVGLRHGTVPGQNTYFTLSPAPANYSTTVLDTVYQGLHASLVSNVRVTDSVIQSSDFDGYLYFRCLTGSDVSLGTIYTVYVRVETYNNTSAPIIKKTMLYAEERIGVTVFYEDSLNNSNFEFITSYNEEDDTSLHTVHFITRRIGDSPRIEITFADENGVEITDKSYPNDLIYYVFKPEEKTVVTENISFMYSITDLQIPKIFEGTTISIVIKATNTEDNNLVYYSNKLLLRVVPYIVTDVIVDGVNNKNEYIKSYGGNYTLNVNISTTGTCKNSTKMSLKKQIAINSHTWWYYDFNEIENTHMFTTLRAKTYEYFTISKNGSYYVYTPNFVGFTDKIYMVVSLSYFKGDADNPAGYIVETNAGPTVTEAGLNPTSQTLNFVLEFVVSSNYRNSEEQALPIYDKEGLENMKEGVYYILDNDITLDNWTPISTAIASLDGNGYEINITSFEVDVEQKIDCYLGLFAEVPSNTVLKNLYVTYGHKNKFNSEGGIETLGSNGKYEFQLDSTALTTLYFGGIAGINNGTIYNCSVKNADDIYYFEFMRTDNKEVINYDVKIAGLVGLNKGWISYSRSELTLQSNVGNMAGLVSENQGTLSSSYYKNGKIVNNSTNSTTSKVAGLCVTNTSSGKIYYSYVEGTPSKKNEFQFTGKDSGLTFAGNIAGFVYNNMGTVSDCYANIPIRPAGGRNAGFVYTTTGTITCCYTLCKYIYQDNNGTNASDTPFVGTNAQGNVNYDSTEATLKNVYYYIGEFISSITEKEPAEGLTQVQFMEDYYFGEYSFSYDDGTYNNYAYEVAYDQYETDLGLGQNITDDNCYSGLDAIWTYDEYHLYPKLVEANNIAVSRKQVSFKAFTELSNNYTTLAMGHGNIFTVATNKLAQDEHIKLTISSGGTVLSQWYNDNNDVCTMEQALSTYYISVYTFTVTPDADLLSGMSQVNVQASVVKKDSEISYDQNNNEIRNDLVMRTSQQIAMRITPEERFEEVLLNETYSQDLESSMNLEYSTAPVIGVKVSEKLGNISLYSAEPGTRGNPEIMADPDQYNSVMYQDPKEVNNGIEKFGNYRMVADIDFSNTAISEDAVNNIFSGTFDGAGFTMEGLTLIDYSKSIDSFGLFNTIKGSSYSTGVVKNLRIVPLKVYANYIFTVGTLAAKVVGGRVYNIIVDADEVTVKGKNIVGGTIGMVLDNIRIGKKYYEFLSDDLVGVKTIYKSIVQNITSTINVNATSRVSSTNYYLISNINSQKTSFYEQNVKVAYAGVAIGAVIQSSGTSRLNKAGVYDVKVIGKSIAVGEIIGTAIGFVGEKSYVDLVSVGIVLDQYLNASLIAGGVIGENRGLVSRATIEHQSGQAEIDAREEIGEKHGSQNTIFFKNAQLAIGGVIGFNNGGVLENSYSRIDCRNKDTIIAGGLVGIVISGEFYNSYVSGSVYAKSIIGGVIGATSTPELFAPLQTAVNATASLISSDSNSQLSRKKEVILDSILGINKWLDEDSGTFYEKVRNSNEEITDAYPIGSMIGSIQLNSKEETNSYDITTYSSFFKKLYVEVDASLGKYFRLYDYGNKISSLVSAGVAYSNTQNSTVYQNSYAEELADEDLQNNHSFKDYSTTIWEYTDRASSKILPALRAVSNLNTKKATLRVKYVDTNLNIKEKDILLIDGVNGEETVLTPLGTSFNPYKIIAPSQLRYFAIHNNILTNGQFKEKKLHLQLADNISLVAYSNWIPIGDGINDYKVTVEFNGAGYQISGITSETATTGTQERFVGLFGYLQTGSLVYNLRTKVRFNLELEGGNIYVGGIAATAYNTSIKNCEVEGKINFLNKYAAYFSIGGIVGQTVSEGQGSSSIEDSKSSVIITSNNIVSRVQKTGSGSSATYKDSVYTNILVNAKVGGIAGFNQNSIIAGCENHGNISMYPVKNQTPLAFTEPIFQDNVYIEDEYSKYSVFADVVYIGGIVGTNIGQIKSSTNYGTIHSYSYAGGIAGTNMDNGQVNYQDEVFNINECINTGVIYLTAGYSKNSGYKAYGGGIAAYSSGSINKSINLNFVYVKTLCQFSVGGIAGAVEKSTNTYITHCYTSVYNEYNTSNKIIDINSITVFKSKSSVELVYGAETGNSGNILNKAGLICNDGTESLDANRIYDNLSYGDINVLDPTNELLSISSVAITGADNQPTGLSSKVTVKKGSNYILEAVSSKVSTSPATYGRLVTGNHSAVFGKESTKTDITYWEKNFFSVPDYIKGDDTTDTIHLSELRWNAKVFAMHFNFTDSDDSDPEIVNSYISAFLENPEENEKEPITPGQENTYYLATTYGYINFELQENWEIYYIMIRRSDSNEYYEFNEADLVSTVITINGYDYGNDALIDLSPGKDVKFTISVKIRTKIIK